MEEYFALTRSAQPYDVFLCFRPDSPYAFDAAQTIHQKLSEKGIRVFPDAAIGSSPTATAFALNHCRILFAITAGNDDLLKPPVCHQWRQFPRLMEADRSKHIYLVCTQTEIYAIPEQIPTHEAICADHYGYWQDLVRGVQQLLGKAVKKTAPDGQDYLKEACNAFEAGDYLFANFAILGLGFCLIGPMAQKDPEAVGGMLVFGVPCALLAAAIWSSVRRKAKKRGQDGVMLQFVGDSLLAFVSVFLMFTIILIPLAKSITSNIEWEERKTTFGGSVTVKKTGNGTYEDASGRQYTEAD